MYTNGNTSVRILRDGTKIREWHGVARPDFPESIDMKITDYCDLGCAYCHESSTVAGRHASVEAIQQVLHGLPAGVEIAIGGGDPLSHPELRPVLSMMRAQGLIPNITINQGHVLRNEQLIRSLVDDALVFGVGVSITSKNTRAIELIDSMTQNMVLHVIAGVHEPSILSDRYKFLVLGYKLFGRGLKAHSEQIEKGIRRWRSMLPLYLGRTHLSFDNLAIEQLGLKRWLSKQSWDAAYMGDDFTFTMYADAVKRQYAPTSRSNNRQPFAGRSARRFFAEEALVPHPQELQC